MSTDNTMDVIALRVLVKLLTILHDNEFKQTQDYILLFLPLEAMFLSKIAKNCNAILFSGIHFYF